MDDFVERRVREREARIASITRNIIDLQKNRREAEAELRAYKDVLNHFGAKDDVIIENTNVDVSYLGSATPRRTRMSDVWRNILTYMSANFPNSTDIDDVRKFCTVNGFDMSDDSLRSQLSVYTSRGWLERVSTGSYRPTQSGASAAGATIEAKSPGSETGNSDSDDSELESDDVLS